MDFGALPPEVNSARMYAGAGVGPLLETEQAWATLSTELYSAAQEYGSAITSLATTWLGPSSSAMTHTATVYGHWLTSTASLAEQTATQASAAGAAYSTAFAATVPPVEVAANRAQLLSLVATNLLGQNTPAIAATEAAYAEMWAQDAAAMYGYAASSQTATSALPTFTPAPQTTSGSAATSSWLQFLQTLIPGYAPGAGLQNLAQLLVSPLAVAFVSSGGQLAVDPLGLVGAFLGLAGLGEAAQAEGIAVGATAVPRAAPVIVTPAPVEARPVIAAAGASSSVGGMSVPPSWARPSDNPVKPFRPDVTSRDRYQAAIPAVPFMPVTNAGRSNQAKVRTEPEYGHVSKVMAPRHPAAG